MELIVGNSDCCNERIDDGVCTECEKVCNPIDESDIKNAEEIRESDDYDFNTCHKQ